MHVRLRLFLLPLLVAGCGTSSATTTAPPGIPPAAFALKPHGTCAIARAQERGLPPASPRRVAIERTRLKNLKLPAPPLALKPAYDRFLADMSRALAAKSPAAKAAVEAAARRDAHLAGITGCP